MASSSSSSISSIVRPSSYDVFINFRGSDTRRNFVFLLHKELKRHEIHAFEDSQELPEGEEICSLLLRAIRGSKIFIPVFSENYAESKYCLMELAEIWECHLSEAQTILPIFIGVEPRDVRNQTGTFKGPFQEHQRKYESAQVEKWKIALKGVGNLKGWHLKVDADIKEQSISIDSIVLKALKELSGSTPLDECEYLIGIDSHINALHSLLSVGSDDVQFVAICGMGGLGKTTIAKAMYNSIFRKFSGSSFLANVREEASQGDKGLVCLQNQILKDICEGVPNISMVSQGSKMIKERLHKAEVLIILDDVDDHKQLDALAGGVNWFGQGSRVLITTRNEGSLNTRKFIQIYNPEVMDFKKSLQLFSFHAFSKNEPPEKYNKLSQEIVQYVDGLPLTLEVLGSFLFDNNDIGEWKDTLRALKDINDEKVPGMSIESYDDKVFEKLKVSYDNLSDCAKIVFLDIACNLAGCGVEEVISIREACGLHPRLAIKELARKHLIKIVETTLIMHDQLRYMGRRIVSKDGGGDLTKYNRLWTYDVIKQLLKEDMGTSMVEGILLNTADDLNWEDFANMTQLRFLNLNIRTINGDLSSLPSKLRWLRLEGCAPKILPANFYHKEIVHLQLSSKHIKKAWNATPRNENQRFQKLKVLIMSGCLALSCSPNFFAWFPYLKILDLTKCKSLQELPDGICQMTSLQILILDHCISIKKLPACIADLKHLVKLSVAGTEIEELPDGVGQLQKLEELNTIWCFKLGKLPTSMGRMRSLVRFYLQCTLALNLPDNSSKLSSLEVLKINSFEGTESLEVSEVQNCDKLTELLNLLSLTGLRVLQISNNKNTKEIHGLHKAEFLEELKVDCCDKLTKLPGLSNLKRLRILEICNCKNLEEIHSLEEFESLEKLHLSGFSKLTELQNLSRLKRLRVLKIAHCEKLEKIHGIEEFESLQELMVYCCNKLTETTRKLHGQGRFNRNYFGQHEGSSSIAIDHGSLPILCVVLAVKPWVQTANIDIVIQSSICFRGKKIYSKCSIKTCVETTSREAIYLHHFNVNGLFFQTKAAIEKLTVQHVESYHACVNVKFWKVFSEDEESSQQIPNEQSSAKLVADFFEWSDTDGDEEDTDEDTDGDEEEDEDTHGDEEEKMLQESKTSLIHYDDEETAGPSLNPSSTAIMERFDSNNGFNLQKMQPNIEEAVNKKRKLI